MPTTILFSIALFGLVGIGFYEIYWKGSAVLLRAVFTTLFGVTLIPYEIYFRLRLATHH